MVKKQQYIKYKKAPQAPRRFKSAYMFFSTLKHKEIREEVGKKKPTTEIAKMVSQAWKNLPPNEREEWDEMARRDKARYEVEKTMYTGPWKVPAKQRAQKDPSAPKRPMSAFLSFSNSKRAMVKQQNAGCGNAEVSRMLAKMWKEAPEEERQLHINREYALRQEYKIAIAKWRKNAGKELDDHRLKREEMALRAVDGISEPDDYHSTGAGATNGAAFASDDAGAHTQNGYRTSTSVGMGERMEYAQHPPRYGQDIEKSEDSAESSEQKNYNNNTSYGMASSANNYGYSPGMSSSMNTHAALSPGTAGMGPLNGAYPAAYPYAQAYPPTPYGGYGPYQSYVGSYNGTYNSMGPYDEQRGSAPIPDGSSSHPSATYPYPAQNGYPLPHGSANHQGYGQYPTEAYGANTNNAPPYYDSHNAYHYQHHQAPIGMGNDAAAPNCGHHAPPKDSSDSPPNLNDPHGSY